MTQISSDSKSSLSESEKSEAAHPSLKSSCLSLKFQEFFSGCGLRGRVRGRERPQRLRRGDDGGCEEEGVGGGGQDVEGEAGQDEGAPGGPAGVVGDEEPGEGVGRDAEGEGGRQAGGGGEQDAGDAVGAGAADEVDAAQRPAPEARTGDGGSVDERRGP